MKVQAPFGFVTGCHAGDKFLVQATLASMRHFCPKVPICLVVDGSFDVSDLEQAYNVIPLRISDLPSAQMRELIGSNFRAKLAAMWEGPFEFFVWLDSDAIVWGDFTSQVRTDLDFQIFWHEISISPDEKEIPNWLTHYYYEIRKLKLFDPEFEWRGWPYFCSGAFACRRNAIPFHRWVEIENWEKKCPGTFAWGEMGMLNYMVHAMAQRGEMRVASADLQHIWVHHGKTDFVKDCQGCGWRFPEKVERPRVGHFCGRKPSVFDFKAYSRPFTIARLEHYRLDHGSVGSWLKVLGDDWGVLKSKARRKMTRLTGVFVI